MPVEMVSMISPPLSPLVIANLQLIDVKKSNKEWYYGNNINFSTI